MKKYVEGQVTVYKANPPLQERDDDGMGKQIHFRLKKLSRRKFHKLTGVKFADALDLLNQLETVLLS